MVANRAGSCNPEHPIRHCFGNPPSLQDPEHRIRKKNYGPVKYYGSVKNVETRACLNLDALSVPEALVHSIRILVVPGIFL